MSRSLLAFGLGALAVIVVACSSSSGDGPGGAAPPGGGAGDDGAGGGSGSGGKDGGGGDDGGDDAGKPPPVPGTHFDPTQTKWSLPATGIDYYETAGMLYTASVGGAWTVMDIDGDGKQDLVVSSRADASGTLSVLGGTASPHWDVYKGGASGFASTPTPWALPATGIDYYVTSGMLYTASVGGAWTVMDVDGDAKLDLVIASRADASGTLSVVGGPASPHWNVYKGGASGFATTATPWALPATGIDYYTTSGMLYTASVGGAWTVMDADGDAKLDLVISSRADASGTLSVLGGSSAPHWDVYKGGSAGFAGAATPWALPATGIDYYTTSGMLYTASVGGAWAAMDFDGDAKPDLVISSRANASGTLSVLGGPSAPHWDVYKGSSAGFASNATPWPLPATGIDYYTVSGMLYTASVGGAWSVLDLDGDRALDLVVTSRADASGTLSVQGGPSSPHWDIYRGSASGFGSTAKSWSLPATGVDYYVTAGMLYTANVGGAWSLADLDGDGRRDLIIASRANASGTLSVQGTPATPWWSLYRNVP